MADDVVQKNVIPPSVLTGQAHQARQHTRHLDHGQMPQYLSAVRHFQLHHHVQRLVQQLRKRVGRIDHQRRQHRAHLAEVIGLDTLPVPRVELVEPQKFDPVLRQCRDQIIAPAGILLIDHLADATGDGVERFTRRPAIEAALDHLALHLLFEPGDADLKELVEI